MAWCTIGKHYYPEDDWDGNEDQDPGNCCPEHFFSGDIMFADEDDSEEPDDDLDEDLDDEFEDGYDPEIHGSREDYDEHRLERFMDAIADVDDDDLDDFDDDEAYNDQED